MCIGKSLTDLFFFESEMLKMEKEFERFSFLGLKELERNNLADLQVFWESFLLNKHNEESEILMYPAMAIDSTQWSHSFLIHGDDAIVFLIDKITDSKKENIFVLQTLFLLGFPVLDGYEDILFGNKEATLICGIKQKIKLKNLD